MDELVMPRWQTVNCCYDELHEFVHYWTNSWPGNRTSQPMNQSIEDYRIDDSTGGITRE